MVKIEVDSHKLAYHPKRVSEWCEKGDCFPIYVEIGLTNRCNHRCIFCALDWVNHEGKDIDREVMLRTLKEMASCGVKSVMFAGEGEPLLHKDICLFVKKAKEYGLDVSITTNGVLFDKEMAEKILPCLKWIRFSVDAGTRERYAKIHKASEKDFDKVLENIKNAVKIKKDKKLQVTIGVQILLIPDNIDEIEILAEKLKGLGADNLQVKPYSQHPLSINKFVVDYSKLKPLKEKLNRFNDDSFEVLFRERTMERLKERDYKECHGLSFFALIDAKGNVIPCNLFYDNPEFGYGNLYEKSFSEIWQEEKRKQVLKKIKEKSIEECREICRLDVVNRYLQRLREPHPHDNFV